VTDTDIDIAAGWEQLANETKARYKHYRPLADAADEFILEAQDNNRIYTGIREFDTQMRGVGQGHMALIQGFTHSGKTLVFLQMLRTNKHKRVILYTPDETSSLVLAKLASIEHGMPARELEEAVARDDEEAIHLLRATAAEEYPNLIVFDGNLTALDMDHAYDEACDVWGAKPELEAYDYAKLLRVAETVDDKIGWVKARSKSHHVATVLLHQMSRSSGSGGKEVKIDGGEYGGEAAAIFVIGVRRKKYAIMEELSYQRERMLHASKGETVMAAAEKIEELERELRIHDHTVSVNLVKNKRPGGDLVEEIDFELDKRTGRLRPLPMHELPHAYRMEREAEQQEMSW